MRTSDFVLEEQVDGRFGVRSIISLYIHGALAILSEVVVELGAQSCDEVIIIFGLHSPQSWSRCHNYNPEATIYSIIVLGNGGHIYESSASCIHDDILGLASDHQHVWHSSIYFSIFQDDNAGFIVPEDCIRIDDDQLPGMRPQMTL